LTSTVGHTDLLLMYDKGALVGLCMQDYKCLCVAVTIRASIVAQKFDIDIFDPGDPQKVGQTGVYVLEAPALQIW